LKFGDVLLATCLRALYRKAASLLTAGKYPADATAPASADVSKTFDPNILTVKKQNWATCLPLNTTIPEAALVEPQCPSATMLNEYDIMLIFVTWHRRIG
jgi:hypothetical protein